MNKTFEGFILSRQWLDIKSDGRLSHSPGASFEKTQLQLIYWLKTDEGPVKVVVTSEKSVFFIPRSKLQRVCDLLQSCGALNSDSWTNRPLALKSFDNESVVAFYFSGQRSLYVARDFLRKHDIFPFEADIQPTERYLMERFVSGSARIEGESYKSEKYRRLINPKLSSSQFLPTLTVLSLDIETSMRDQQLYSIAAYVNTYSPNSSNTAGNDSAAMSIVFMLGAETTRDKVTRFCVDEKSLFSQFMRWFDDVDPDLIIGWNVINFDLRFLQKKANFLGLPFLLGRERKEIDWRQSREDSHHYTLTVPGRAILDGIDTLKSASYNFESFSLQYVATKMLKRGKLIHSVDDRGAEITRLFSEDKFALAQYNLEDCRLVWDIFTHAKLIRFSLDRSKMTGLAMDRFGGSVAAFDNQYLPRLHRKGYVAPVTSPKPQGVGSPGGYVMESQPGIYNNVLVLDFKSLYPSIIRTFKVDPLAMVLALKEEEDEASPFLDAGDDQKMSHFVPGFNGAKFDKGNAILPELIDELWLLRDEAKREKNDAMSSVIKILMNSFYGVLGTPGCRFFDYRLPSSITLRGHEILQKTKSLVEEKGYRVIYGDTDSLFVWLHETVTDDRSALFECGEALAASLNSWWSGFLRDTYGLDSYLELEFESCFSIFLMPTTRGSDLGSKKRYAGRRIARSNSTERDDMVFRGLEAVRTDWTSLARSFQRELYRRIFYNEPFEEFVRQTVREVYSGERDEQLVYRKRIRRQLDDYRSNVPPHVQAARKADQQWCQSGNASRYARGGWIQYVITVNGPEALECRDSELDYELYIERQIAPIVDGIVPFLGTSFDRIAGKQLGLF